MLLHIPDPIANNYLKLLRLKLNKQYFETFSFVIYFAGLSALQTKQHWMIWMVKELKKFWGETVVGYLKCCSWMLPRKPAEDYGKSSETFASVLAVIRRECLPNNSTEFFRKLNYWFTELYISHQVRMFCWTTNSFF